jgi:mRNA interferase MazF
MLKSRRPAKNAGLRCPLPRESWVKISQIRTLALERIGSRIGRASPEEMIQVVEGLNEIVGT